MEEGGAMSAKRSAEEVADWPHVWTAWPHQEPSGSACWCVPPGTVIETDNPATFKLAAVEGQAAKCARGKHEAEERPGLELREFEFLCRHCRCLFVPR